MLQISLKAARVNAGYLQREVAHEIGVSIETIKNWENNKTSPTADRLQDLCDLYGVRMDDIFFNKKFALRERSSGGKPRAG